MTPTTVQDATGVARLAAVLLSPARALPHCVVSTPPGATQPLLDAEALARDLDGSADVTVLPTGALTWDFARLMPDRCAVWGGAGRVYPAGTGWIDDPLSSPLRFVYAPADAARARGQLLDDGLRMAAAHGGRSVSPRARERRVEAVVQGAVAGGARAFARTTDGATVTITADFVLPAVPIDWYLANGLAVTGDLDESSGRLRIRLLEATEAALLARFGSGTVTLALVAETGRQQATLLLHPTVPVVARRADVSSNPLDLVSQLLGTGEVVPVRVLRDPQGRLGVRLQDLDDDEEVLPAAPLVAGGPPWLVPGRDLVTPAPEEPAPPELAEHEPEAEQPPEPLPPVADAAAPAPARPPVPIPGPGRRPARVSAPPPAPPALPPPAAPSKGAALQEALNQLAAARAEVQRLRTDAGRQRSDSALILELGQERATSARLREELNATKRDAADLRKRARARTTTPRSPSSTRDRFDTAVDWIRHEVHLAWIDRLGAAERRARPLGEDWVVGDRFAATVEVLPDPQLRKVFRSVVDVVLGLDAELDGRDLHQLRSGTGGDDPPLVRASDGATCWRVAVERESPNALRLHYWRTRGGVELARVVAHDDFRP